MKQNITILLFIKIFVFIVSTWIYHFNNDLCMYNIYWGKKCILIRKLGISNCRLLEECKSYNDPFIKGFIEDIPHNEACEKKDIYYNKRGIMTKKKQTYRNTLNYASENKKTTKNKSGIFETKKYSDLEKKIFKELDYTNFLKNNKAVSDRIYKKIIFKKCGLQVLPPFLLFLFFLIVCIVELALGLSGKDCLLSYFGLKKTHLEKLVNESEGALYTFVSVLKKITGFWKHSESLGSGTTCTLCSGTTVTDACILGQFFRILIYMVPLVILGVTFISWIFYYHKKVKKYEKIKFRKR
ncbi:fam-l protein [Plasmodium brasilianum]|uniref:fam-l protein n=1 Tax=Plasmodium brasilianum TaxID=5824 RepID=UPI00350E360C|nr:fam-l protein [Plasmodium brasilianum]